MGLSKIGALYAAGLTDMARDTIAVALRGTSYNLTHAATSLGVSRRCLYNWIEKDSELKSLYHSERQRLQASGRPMKGYSPKAL